MGQSRDKEREQGRGSGSDGVVSGGFRSWRHRDAKLQQSGRGVYTRESASAGMLVIYAQGEQLLLVSGLVLDGVVASSKFRHSLGKKSRKQNSE
ncbi:hypothetical protein GmHk_10G030324 [Glycine max]|nr:hypothetical protein GmHk_10G030324 [Glycine max]